MNTPEGPSAKTSDELGSIAGYIGKKVRRMRTDQGLTLEQVAARVQISVGALSQLERGLGNPSLHTLFRVANAFGSTTADLLRLEPQAPQVVRRSARRTLATEGQADDALFQLLTPKDAQFEVMWIESQPGHSTRDNPFIHPGQEMQLIISGARNVHIGEDSYLLQAGDSITYVSSVPHWYENVGPDPVVSIWVHSALQDS